MAVLTAVVTSSKTCPFSVGDHDVVSIGLDVLVKLLIVDNISLSLTRCCSLQLQLCGRGSVCYSHNGNQQFRSLVESLKSEYARAEQRLGKSLVIRKVVDGIRSNSGRFIKFDPHSGRAFEVGDVEAVSRNNLWIFCCVPDFHITFKCPCRAREKRHHKPFVTHFSTSIGQAMHISTKCEKGSQGRLLQATRSYQESFVSLKALERALR